MRKWEGWNYNANLDQPHGDDSVVGKKNKRGESRGVWERDQRLPTYAAGRRNQMEKERVLSGYPTTFLYSMVLPQLEMTDEQLRNFTT